MYRSQKYQDVAGTASIIDLSLTLHGYCTGSVEHHPNYVIDVYEILKEVIDTWKPGLIENGVFDNACKIVVLSALHEYEHYRKEVNLC